MNVVVDTFVLFPTRLTLAWKTILILTIIHVLAMIYWSASNDIGHQPSSSLHQSNIDENFDSLMTNNNDNNDKTWSVEIWSKSAIGQYLWENILQARTEPKILPDNLYIEGSKSFGRVTFHFRSGPSLKPESLAQFNVENIILILNWRSLEKIKFSLKWLDVVVDRLQTDDHHQEDDNGTKTIKNVGIIALGDEKCNNQWFKQKYLDLYKRLRFLFIIYDWNQVDNQKIFQWPLGIATYRNFPPSSVTEQTSLINLSRPYLCNFMATVYPNSSREELEKLFINNVEDDANGMKHLRQKCLIKTRSKWSPNEDTNSMNRYVEALRSSDLTLSPLGMNHECYRILEAVEYGSIPVIEENRQHLHRRQPQCDQQDVLRLFRKFQAPFIYLTNWTEQLPGILKEYERKSLPQKIHERIHLMKWYHRFKIRLKNKLVNIIQKKFL